MTDLEFFQHHFRVLRAQALTTQYWSVPGDEPVPVEVRSYFARAGDRWIHIEQNATLKQAKYSFVSREGALPVCVVIEHPPPFKAFFEEAGVEYQAVVSDREFDVVPLENL